MQTNFKNKAVPMVGIVERLPMYLYIGHLKARLYLILKQDGKF